MRAAEQLEALGKDASELRRQINQSMRTGGRRPAPAAPAKPTDQFEALKAKYSAAPIAQSGEAAPEQRRGATPALSEARRASGEAAP